jgi:6-phosphofructokinase
MAGRPAGGSRGQARAQRSKMNANSPEEEERRSKLLKPIYRPNNYPQEEDQKKNPHRPSQEKEKYRQRNSTHRLTNLAHIQRSQHPAVKNR